jgi:hypothetical protein
MKRQGFDIATGQLQTKFDAISYDNLHHIPFDLNSLPHGWLSPTESRFLYNLARVSKGPVMEVGSWIGRSTCALAYGIRDNPSRPIFDVFDLGLVGFEEWAKWFGADPRTTHGPEIIEVLETKGGTGAVLRQNLYERRLDQYVNMIVLGDFKKSGVARKYSTCFCDVSHDKAEIDANVPSLMEMIHADDFLIVFDDLWSLEASDYVSRMTKAERTICLGGVVGGGECKASVMARGSYAQMNWWFD